MPSGSTLISELNSERILYPMNTSVFSQTQTGPSTPMAYFVTWVRFMSWILITFDFVFSNIHMITPWKDILVKQKCYTKSDNTISGLDFPFISRTTAGHVPPVPEPNTCTTSLTDCSSNSRSLRDLEFYLHGFHREASPFIRLYLNPSCC